MNDYENFEKGMIYMKILKKGGGSREKGGGGNEIHAPCACESVKACSFHQRKSIPDTEIIYSTSFRYIRFANSFFPQLL